MAERQYIGARYVPKFFVNSLGTSEWTSNTAYEALTIVTRNGNSYTSKIPVPASVGAPEDNADYWVSTGIYNAQIEEIMDSVEENAQAISDESDAREAADEILGSARNNRKYIVLTDSYGMRYTNSWSSIWESRVPNSIVSAVSSIGFATTPNNFLTSLQAVENTLSADDKLAVTDIVVGGGWNDARVIHTDGNTPVIAGIASFCNYALTHFPNAIVHLAYMGWQLYGGGQDGVTLANIINARACWRTVALPNLRFVNNSETPMFDPTCYDETKFHPNNSRGAEQLFGVTYGGVNGGSNYFGLYTPTFEPYTDKSGSVVTAMSRFTQCNYHGNLQLNIGGINGTFGAGELAYLGYITNLPPMSNSIIANCVQYSTREAMYCVIQTNGLVVVYPNSATMTNETLLITADFDLSMA